MSDPSTAPDHASHDLALATGKLHYLQGGTGEPVVVLHHSTGPLGWLPFHAALAREATVFAPELPGYGRSERPEWARDPRDLALLIARFLERLGLRDATLVGLGFGGFVAAELVSFNPDLVGGLVLVGAAGLQPEQGEIVDQMLIAHAQYVRTGFRDDAAYREVFGDEVPDDVATLWDFSREMTARVCWKPYMFNRRLPHALADVEVPVLLVWGEQDRIVPPICGEQYARVLSNSRLEIVPGAGHLLDLEEPEDLAQRVIAHAHKALRKS